jgi:dihydroorotase
VIKITNVRLLDGEVSNYECSSSQDFQLDAQGSLTLFPALIDPHFSFGSFDQQKWQEAIFRAIKGGISIVINSPSKSEKDDKEAIENRKKNLENLLHSIKLSLQVEQLGNFIQKPNDLGLSKEFILGSVFNEYDSLSENEVERLFQLAAWEDLPMVVDLAALQKESVDLLEKSLHFAERQSTRLYFLNLSSEEELNSIRKARKRSMLIYAETTPQHLFNDRHDFLWEAINRREIETIGSGYQNDLPNFLTNNPLSNPIHLLPYLVTSALEGKCSLEKIIQICRKNFFDIFKIKSNQDAILVDMKVTKPVVNVNKMELSLTGWPAYSIFQGCIYPLNEMS